MTAGAWPAELQITVTRETKRAMVAPIGEIDLATVSQVELQLLELADEGFRHLVLDLRAVSFLDSTMIRLLVDQDRRAAMAGGRFSVILGAPQVCRPLRIAGVIDRLDVVEA